MRNVTKESRGSLYELRDQLSLAAALNYITESEYDRLEEESITVGKVLSGLISKHGSRSKR